jgi:hypothetical protein
LRNVFISFEEALQILRHSKKVNSYVANIYFKIPRDF